MQQLINSPNERVPFYELAIIANGGSVRTFGKKIYQIKGIMAKNIMTGEVQKLSSIYYEIRTVKDIKGQVVAKRKKPIEELKRVI
ncbi:hypothetical protein [Ornithinibacillus contaminans]|uniref:hypothetical protein n=1 Tax=Ornithinibacillus contaminans TaxID=694055 RepID=UPI00064D9733|nr:hypothetical protein [Ornithinibacillus contaminans]